jgi:type IV secretion system protein VirB8
VTGAPALEAYFAEAESWDADRAAESRRSARTAWWVAAAGWLCAIASALALALLMPLKQVIPYLVRVDGSTGIVDVVPVFTGPATPEEAVTRYFLTHYVSVCERFNFATAESDYEWKATNKFVVQISPYSRFLDYRKSTSHNQVWLRRGTSRRFDN